MISEKEPNKKIWSGLTDEEVDDIFADYQHEIGGGFSGFFFLLTEASEDYLVYEGLVYKKRKTRGG